MTTPTDELLPCPHCKGLADEYEGNSHGASMFSVICDDCGSMVQHPESITKVRERWNTRTPSNADILKLCDIAEEYAKLEYETCINEGWNASKDLHNLNFINSIKEQVQCK